MKPAEPAARATRLPSLGRNSAARFVADGAGLVFGIVGGVITARALGPEGKGLFSSLTFLAAVMMQVSSVGLGDAAIVLVGQRRATIQEAVSATVAAALGAAVLGSLILWGAALVAFQADWEQVRSAAIIASLGLPISLFAYMLTFVLSAREMIVSSSVVLGVTAALTTVGIFVLVVVVPLSVAGGVLGGLVGATGGLLVAWWFVSRSGVSLWPRWDWAYLRPALRYGVTVETSYVVTVMFLRADLLFVYALAGSEPAGQYSVALTISALVSLLPTAISYATFPRLANLDPGEANELTAQACRFGVLAAGAGAVLLFVATPVVVPLLFGSEFDRAVVPALILLPGSVIWSTQWLLCRAAAAQGRPGLLVQSFGLGLLVMSVLDLALVPHIGITGAALAAVGGPAAGLALCLGAYHRSPWWPLPLRSLVPRGSDVRSFAEQSVRLFRRRPGAAGDAR